MGKHPLSKPTAIKLFETKSSSVRAVVIGPAIGHKWRVIKYYRLQQSTKEPGKWVEITNNWRVNDNPHLAKCVKLVQAFLDQEPQT